MEQCKQTLSEPARCLTELAERLLLRRVLYLGEGLARPVLSASISSCSEVKEHFARNVRSLRRYAPLEL